MKYKWISLVAMLGLAAGLAGCGGSSGTPCTTETVSTDCQAPTNECKAAVCTDGTCDETNVADGTSCDGGSGVCMSGSCAAAACTTANEAEKCDDSNECTVDSCDSGTCKHDNATDGTACNSGAGTCQSGACVTPECTAQNEAEKCDDSNDCTADSCDSNGMCQHSNAAAGTTCTVSGNAGECNDAGVCQPTCSTAADCDDGNECTTNTCGDNNMCETANVADGTACGTGDMTCMAGVCKSSGGETPAPQTVTACLYCPMVPIIGNVSVPASATVAPMGPFTAGASTDVQVSASTTLTIPLDAMATINTGTASYAVSGATPVGVDIAVPMQTLTITANVPATIDGGTGTVSMMVGSGATAVTAASSSIFLDLMITSPFPVAVPLTCAPIDSSDPKVAASAVDGCTGEVPPGPPPTVSFPVN